MKYAKIIIGIVALSQCLLAQDQTVSGNLTVTGDADIEGSALSLGTRSDSSTTPGITLLYADAEAPSIYLSATRNNASWIWQMDGGRRQMELGGGNQLKIFDQSSVPVVGILLNPAGESSISSDLIINGQLKVPNQNQSNINGVVTFALADQIYLRKNINSLKLGSNTVAGPYAFAFGFSSNASGYDATAINGGSAAGYGAFSVGSSSIASGTNSSSIGYSTKATGPYAMALGDSSEASGSKSVAIGYYSKAVGEYSFAAGTGSNAGGSMAIALGYIANASGYRSMAFGEGAAASGQNSIALGRYVTAQGKDQVVVGYSNVIQGDGLNIIPSDDLFIVGNGTGSVRANAFVVKKNGDMRVSGNSGFNGNVGVGVESPVERVEVNGNIKASGIVMAAKVRVPESGDLSMGVFTAGANPAP
jgi:hypothetical protein